MRGDSHAGFCESRGVRFPPATLALEGNAGHKGLYLLLPALLQRPLEPGHQDLVLRDLDKSPVLLEAHGGELDGFFLLRGDQDKLARIRSSEEFERLTVRAQLIVENLGIVGAALGERLISQLSVFGAQVEELT